MIHKEKYELIGGQCYDLSCLKDAIIDTCVDALNDHLTPMLVRWSFPRRLFKPKPAIVIWGPNAWVEIKTPKGVKKYKITVTESKKD